MPIYQRGEQRDNCGFGLIAHLDGEPSHRLVRIAIGALDRMDHRGAIGADGKTGDGCGLLLQKPDAFFQSVAREQGFRLANRYAVGVIFLGHGPERLAAVQHVFAEELERETLTLAGWRDVPRDPGCPRSHRPQLDAGDDPGLCQRSLRLGTARFRATALHGAPAHRKTSHR